LGKHDPSTHEEELESGAPLRSLFQICRRHTLLEEARTPRSAGNKNKKKKQQQQQQLRYALEDSTGF
jgi:hypothetical protein